MKKNLPDDLLVIISRTFGRNVWVLDDLLKDFLEKLQAKESCKSYLEIQITESEKNEHGFSASGFYSENRELKSQKSRCLLSRREPPSITLFEMTSFNSRKEVLRKFSKCFICLTSGHLAKNCLSKCVCHKCNQRHHIPFALKTRTRAKTGGGFYCNLRRQKFSILQVMKNKLYTLTVR